MNLLVGENNCGKTSVLEAIDLLVGAHEPRTIWKTLAQRGEWPDSDEGDGEAPEVDVTHLFRGHQAGSLSLRADNEDAHIRLDAKLTLPARKEQLPTIGPDFAESEGHYRRAHREGSFFLAFDRGQPDEQELTLPVGGAGELAWENVRFVDTRMRSRGGRPAQFLTTRPLNARHIVDMFSSVALQDDESIVIDALRTIEPGIERIAVVSNGASLRDRGGLALRLEGARRRVPIGSLGDGIWRLLALTLSLVRAKGGVLLVDEIDTGLHYSVLAKMWTLVMKTAERLDVQVFAATHSRDCVESLAAICREEPDGLSRVSIQRIERHKAKAIAFTEREILLAAERGIEVR